MAVLVSNGNTTLSTTNGFYRSDAYNAGCFGGLTHSASAGYYGQVLSTARYIPLTFASGGSCMGVILSVNRAYVNSRNTSSNCNKDIIVRFQEAHTPVTITIASPGVVTDTAHGLSDGTEVVFLTTGALPTGLTAGTPYYINASATADPINTYWVYTTQANAIAGGSTGRINTSGTQSGTHTAWITRVSVTKTSAQIWHDVTYRSGYKFLDFSFGAGYAIDTSAGKWQLRVVQGAGTGDYYLTCSDGTTTPAYPFYITYSNNAATASSVFLKGITFNNTNETINYGSAHGLSDGDRVCLFADLARSDYALPTGLTAGNWYYVRDVGTYGPNGFRVETSVGGGVVTFSTNGGGTWYCARPDDMIVCKDKVTIDRDFAFRPYNGTGYTGRNAGVILCDSPSTSNDPHNWAMLDWENAPAAQYDILISGGIVYDNHATWTVGTKLNPIPYAQLARIWCSYVAYTGSHTGYAGLLAANGLQYYGAQGGGYAFYGEKPAASTMAPKLTVAATVGTSSLTVDSNTGWAAGDRFYLTKSAVNGVPDGTLYEVASTSGSDTINLTATTIATYDRPIGARLIKRINTCLGVEIRSTQATANNFIYKESGALTVMSGCFLYYTYCRPAYTSSHSYNDYTKIQPALFEYCLCGIRASPLSGYNICPPGGATIDNVHIAWALTTSTGMIYTPQKVNKGTTSSSQVWTSGSPTISNCTFWYGYWQSDFYAINGQPVVHDNQWHNIYNGIYVAGSNVDFYNNEIFGEFGSVSTDPRYSGIYLSSVRSTRRWENNSYDYCTQAIYLPLNGLAVNTRAVRDKFGTIGANTVDIVVLEENYSQITFDTPDTAGLIIDGDLTTTASGFALNIQNDTITNDDKSYRTYGTIQRCGDGLADTTVHTVGSGKFSMRFESLASSDPLVFESIRPTGNIQNRDLIVAVWCKINSATYYAGTHQMPRLTVNFDNGAEVYVEALQSTAWQLVTVPVSPLTTFGQIKVTFSTRTDAIGSDAYVYWDDASILDPSGVVVNTGGLDLWSDGVPITPIISTSISAQDVWAADPALFGIGTVGESVSVIKKVTANNLTKNETGLTTIYEDDGATIFRQYQSTTNERTRL